MRMYSAEQRMKAVETFARFGCSAADTIAELGYPTRHTLRNWWGEYQIGGDGFLERKRREPKYSDEEKRGAVDYYLEHGRSLARTTRAMGYPSRETLGSWIDELAPDKRRRRGPNPEKGVLPIETKVQAVAELEARGGSAAEVADRYGVSRTAPYAWRREILGHNGGAPEEKGAPVSKRYDELPNGVEELKKMQSDLKAQVRKLQLEIDVRQATLEMLKKDPGTDPKRLTNAEKAAVISSLRPKWKLKDLLALTRMAKSSYEYAAAALARPESARGGRQGVRRQRGRLRLSKDRRPDGRRRVDRARDHGRGVARRPRRQEEAPLQLLPGRGVRGAGQPAAGRAREAPLQGGRAERALGDGRHGVPHPRGKVLPLPGNRLLRRHADKLGDLHVPERRDGELLMPI